MNTPQTNQQDLVIFHILPRQGVRWHLAIAAILIAAGIAVQALLLDELIGALLLLAGTLFLTAKGYDSRIKLVEYDPTTTWEPAASDTLTRMRDLAKQARRWDRSALDVSNWLILKPTPRSRPYRVRLQRVERHPPVPVRESGQVRRGHAGAANPDQLFGDRLHGRAR